MRPRLLDLFCGAGGAGMGYHRAGFDVVGVDINPQPRYPFDFIQGDAIAYAAEHGTEYDAIHASPPCQAFSALKSLVDAVHGDRRVHANLIEPVRRALIASCRPYVIENVPGAPLIDPVKLCGSSFGRPIRRHRLFESRVALLTPPCAHRQMPIAFQVSLGDARTRPDRPLIRSRFVGVYGNTHQAGDHARWREAMGIDWMVRRELTQAIPPDYTELLGGHLIAALSRGAVDV